MGSGQKKGPPWKRQPVCSPGREKAAASAPPVLSRPLQGPDVSQAAFTLLATAAKPEGSAMAMSDSTLRLSPMFALVRPAISFE